jgi:hypothetical protein
MSGPGSEEGTYEVPFQVLLADARRRCDGVGKELESLTHAYQSRWEEHSYREFAAALRLVNQAARARLDEMEGRFARAPEATYDRVKSLMEAFASRHERYINALRLPRAEALRLFAQPFTRQAKLIAENVELLFFGWSLDRYELKIYDEAAVVSVAKDIIEREYGGDIQFLQFWHPLARQHDLFQHPVFGHELGHPAIARQAVPKELVAWLGITSEDPVYLDIAREAGDEAVSRNFNSDERKRLIGWLTELACDIFAMRFLGPAFAFAFTEVTSVNRELERAGNQGEPAGGEAPTAGSYPPTRLRLRVLRDELDEFGFGRYQTALEPITERLDKTAVSTRDPETEIPDSEAWIDAALDAFRAYAIPALLGRNVLSPESLEGDLQVIWPLAEQRIPPAERLLIGSTDLPGENDLGEWSRECDWRSILNGVLLWHLADGEKRAAAGDDLDAIAKGRKEAIALALGAIEMSEFHRRARVLEEQYSPMQLEKELADDW